MLSPWFELSLTDDSAFPKHPVIWVMDTIRLICIPKLECLLCISRYLVDG